MKLAIMQPYFFPYVGYFQLMNAVEEFVVYDNIQFSKEGWVNRNRILSNGNDAYITLPLKKASDYLDIRERYLADIWNIEKRKMLNRIAAVYRKAPMFDATYPIFEKSVLFEGTNLFTFILNSLTLVKEYLGVETSLVISSSIPMDHTCKAEKRVIETCKARNATFYLNAIGGVQLYSKDHFLAEGIDLHFIRSTEVKYRQFNDEFIPWLSILDVMMFNKKEEIKTYLNSHYEII